MTSSTDCFSLFFFQIVYKKNGNIFDIYIPNQITDFILLLKMI